MKAFNIWMAINGSLEAVKAPKAAFADKTPPLGFTVLQASLKASTKSAAIKQYLARVESGLITPKPPKAPSRKNVVKALDYNFDKPVNKVMFVDFNGVLDDIEKESNDSNLKFKLPKIACPEKIIRLVKLALKHDAKMVFISEHRKFNVGLKVIIGRCLLHSGNEEHANFYNENKLKISELTRVRATPVLNSRSQEVREYILDEAVTHCVVFEDSHPIDEELNLVRIQWSEGLQDRHIEEADKLLA